MPPKPARRKKSLLIGINYFGSKSELHGCLEDIENVAEMLRRRGYPDDERSQVVMRDDRRRDSPLYPTGHNMIAAMDWLVKDPNTTCFLHYSGHGGQVKSPAGDRASGLDDTIVPVDYERNGQIPSDVLHKHLVTNLKPSSKLFIVFDCCHSGSATELPFVYRSDSDGNVNLMDNLKEGMRLVGKANRIMEGGIDFRDIAEAKDLAAGATDFFRGLTHMGGGEEEGLQEDKDQDEWAHENKHVSMFSGCRDDQTSADATIKGESQGALSWALLETLSREPHPTYLKTLQMTRQLLDQSNYTQIPQLSMGRKIDLETPLQF